MFYGLKKGIMCRALAKRNKQKSFDYAYAESFTLDGESDPLVNNSYYFSAHDGNLSFFARLGRRVNEDETWFAIYREGQIYSLKQASFPSGQSPLCIEKAGDNWKIAFNGVLNEQEEISFHAVFVAKQKPIDFTSDMPAARMATGIANEKWNKAFFEELQQVSGQCHYEQEGMLEGSFTMQDQTVDFQLPCVRDHSFGKRDWSYMNNHLWLMAVSSSRQFNYSLVSYPVLSVLEVGNYRDEAGMHYLLQADLDFQQVGKGTVPQELAFRIKLDDRREIKVAARVLAGVSYPFKEGQYILHENVAEFEIDGHTCRGILEIGFNSRSDRFFNQRDLNSIQR